MSNGGALARTVTAGVLVMLAGAGALGWGTDGFRAYTAETARREQVLRRPRPLPAVSLEDQDGRPFRLQDYRGRSVAVEFIFTRCETLCRALGAAFKQIRGQLPPGSDVALVSVSFDPRRDDPPALKRYAQAHGADGEQWRVARPLSEADLGPLLEAFGVVVIPDGLGGFEHNAAIHLLDRQGRLVQISDIGEPASFVAGLRPRL